MTGTLEPFIPDSVLQKLMAKHNVAASEVIECFANRKGPSLTDNREEHRTNPPTRWFIAETDMGRKLKVVYIPIDNSFIIKTAYPANPIELEIYRKVAGVCF